MPPTTTGEVIAPVGVKKRPRVAVPAERVAVIVLDAPHERAPTVQIDSLTPIIRASDRGDDDATLRRAQDELKRRVNAGEVPAQRGCRF